MSENLKKDKLFYGWVIVASGFLILFVTYGVQFSFNVFFPILIKQFSWSRKDLSGAFSLYTIVYTAMSPVVGRIIDTYGTKRIVYIGGILLCTGWGMMSQVNRLWHVYIYLGVIAGLGMSTSFVSVNSTIVKWFIEKRGLALGIALSGNGVGLAIIPLVVGLFITIWGWRSTYMVIAFIVLIFMIGSGKLLVSPRERYVIESKKNSNGLSSLQNDLLGELNYLKPREAMITASFWLIALSFSLNAFSIFMPFVHLTAFSLDIGFPTRTSIQALSIIGFCNLLGRLLGGPFSDKIMRKKALMIALLIQAGSWFFLFHRQNFWGLYLFAILFGTSYGFRVTIFPGIIADYFGRAFSGSIIGIIFCIEGAAAGLGVFCAGYVFDASGSYDIYLWLAIIGNMLALLSAFELRSPDTFWKNRYLPI